MDVLAAAAKTTKPTLYARFGSKEQLYERIVRREADAFMTHILDSYDLPATLTVHETVERSVAAWFEYLDVHAGVLHLLFAPDRSAAAQEIAEEVEVRIITGLMQAIERTITSSGRSTPVGSRFLASMVFGATLQATRDNIRTGELTTPDAVALATSFLYAGYVHVDLDSVEAGHKTGRGSQSASGTTKSSLKRR